MAAWLCPDPLGEFAALRPARPPSWISGAALRQERGEEGRAGDKKDGVTEEGKGGKGGTGENKGRTGMGKGVAPGVSEGEGLSETCAGSVCSFPVGIIFVSLRNKVNIVVYYDPVLDFC